METGAKGLQGKINAAAHRMEETKMQAEQWRTIDITIKTKKEYRNPFQEVDVFGVLVSPFLV